MAWIHIPHTTSSTVSADTADSPSDSASPTRTPTSGRSPISSGTSTASKSSDNASAIDSWMTLQSGEETFGNLTASPGVESWILLLQAHHAPVSRSPGTALEARMTAICSRKRSDYLTRYDRPTQSWKMSQVLLWENDPIFGTFSVEFPRSGFMSADGTLYRLKMPKPRTNGPAGGASPDWPTPTPWQQDESVESWANRREREKEKGRNGNGFGIPLDMAVKMLPTPTSRDHKDGDAHSCQNVPVNGLLGREVHMLPTPTSGHGSGGNRKSDLRNEARMLPTPSSGGDSGGPHGIRGGSWAKERLVEVFGEEDAVAMSGGSLSPDWVSWLMGLSVGWTSLEPLPREEYLDWLHAQQDGTWWQEERGLPRIATGIKDRVNRLKCLGNGIVPASLSLFLRGATWSTGSDNTSG
jgi:hypothetical protein